MAGAKLGGHGHELSVKLLDHDIRKVALEPVAQALAGDEARAAEIEVEKAEQPATGQAAGELFESVEAACEVAGSGDRADGRTGDDVRFKACLGQGLEDSDMGPTTGRSAAKGDAKNRFRPALTPDRSEPSLPNI